MQKIKNYFELMRFERPIGTLLLLWSTLSALWIANQGVPSLQHVIIFTCGVVVMRAAGSVINDYADRNFDGKVKRTANRPLATGKVSAREALLLFLGLLVIALGLVLQLNLFSLQVAMMGAAFTLIYPFSKRFFACPQMILGITWSFGILVAFAAVQNALPMVAWLLFLANFTLTMAYDTMYAMSDRDDDVMLGLHSSAILFGQQDKLLVAINQLATVILWLLIGKVSALSGYFYTALICASMLFIYQHHLIKDRDREKCFQAFLNNKWFGLIILIGIVVSLK